MRTEILYVELKQGHSGPAWIGYGHFSKSGQTVYFDGKVLKKEQGIISNHFDIENGDEYWISGVKKNGTDRHWAGSGKIYIDKTVIDDYLKIIGQTTLPKNKFILADLDNVPNKKLSRTIENSKLTDEPFDNSLLYKKTPKDLSDNELKKVIEYYSDLDLTELPLKTRKGYVEKLNDLNVELETRNNNA
ncbi:MAG: hypothetical protein MUC49_19560 [Raineya sp.]|jgi:hypothetical protein|nr:hypothetical protein [Raineya sp.]